MNQLKKPLAFSLIELVIVIAVIAILALIGGPSYSRYLQRASLAEAISVLAEYKLAMSLFWSVQSRLPTTGDTLNGTPVDLPFGTAVTAALPSTIQSIELLSAGNGSVIKIVIQASAFSSLPATNRQLALGVKGSGNQLLFVCGNYSTNASSSSDLGFTDSYMLPAGCNYNGVGDWLST